MHEMNELEIKNINWFSTMILKEHTIHIGTYNDQFYAATKHSPFMCFVDDSISGVIDKVKSAMELVNQIQ